MISIDCLMNWRIDDMKKVFCIAGTSLVLSTVVATIAIVFNCKKNESELSHDSKKLNEESAPSDKESSIKVLLNRDTPLYNDVKNSIIESVYSRHKGAITIMSDSVEKIRENNNVPDSTNNAIDEVYDELDRMLSEG